jgi:hypothetical protein
MSVHCHLRPPKPLSLGARVPEAGSHTLNDEAPLKGADGAEYRKDHLANRRRRVHLLGEGNEFDAQGAERL